MLSRANWVPRQPNADDAHGHEGSSARRRSRAFSTAVHLDSLSPPEKGRSRTLSAAVQRQLAPISPISETAQFRRSSEVSNGILDEGQAVQKIQTWWYRMELVKDTVAQRNTT